MLLWLIFAGLTAIVLAVVLRPAFAEAQPSAAARPADLAVYTAQLTDLDQQAVQGRLDPAEHIALRHEIARRILRADLTQDRLEDHARDLAPDQAQALAQNRASPSSPAPAPPPNFHSRTTALIAAAVVPLFCLSLYLVLGRPGLPAHPFASGTLVTAQSSADDLIAQVEARLASNPEDARGWDVIAPIYLRLQRFADAANAYEHSLSLSGDTPQRLAGFAEATVMANDGIVTDAARAAYEKLAAANPEQFAPRFWLALSKEQDGQRDAAATAYRAMLAVAPADAPWRPLVEQHLAAVTSLPPPSRGPTAADVSAASGLDATQRSAMIATMVESLAARLKANGRDTEGWQRLITSYATLKQPDKAKAAVINARAALEGDAPALAALNDLAGRLGVQP